MFNEVHSSHGHTLLLITKPYSASYGIIATFKAIAGHNRKTA